MAEWISQNLKYPGEAVKSKITGKVYVDFMVSSTGKVKNVQVNKPVHPLLDAEAKRVISNMPDWKPGSQAGKPIDVQIMVPVEFQVAVKNLWRRHGLTEQTVKARIATMVNPRPAPAFTSVIRRNWRMTSPIKRIAPWGNSYLIFIFLVSRLEKCSMNSRRTWRIKSFTAFQITSLKSASLTISSFVKSNCSLFFCHLFSARFFRFISTWLGLAINGG